MKKLAINLIIKTGSFKAPQYVFNGNDVDRTSQMNVETRVKKVLTQSKQAFQEIRE